MKNLEENQKELEEINAKLDEKKKELDKLENEVSELKENYPEVSYEELAQKSDINEYVHKVIDLKQKEIQLQDMKAEYVRLDQEKIDLESVKDQLLKNQNEVETKNEIEKEEQEVRKQEFMDEIAELLSKKGILKGNEAVSLACKASSLQNCKFLSEEEKQNLKNQIDEKLADNNKLINESHVKIKEPKVKVNKKLNIKNKTNSIVAKGKKPTIDSIKNRFTRSIGKVVSNVQGLYQKFCNSRKKSIQQQLDSVIEALNAAMEDIEVMREEYKNQNEMLQKKLDDLEQHYKKQDSLNETFSSQINDDEKKEETEQKSNNREIIELYKMKGAYMQQKKYNELQNQENSQSMAM